MLNTLFLLPVILYFVASALQISALVFKKDVLKKLALIVLAASVAIHTAYIVARGVAAGRVPMSNQVEFANAFAWGVALLGLFFRLRYRDTMQWMVTLCAPIAFLIISPYVESRQTILSKQFLNLVSGHESVSSRT